MIGLVHLVWAPLGAEPLRRFLHSYHDHSAGAEHELVVLLNGLSHPDVPAGGRERLLAELADFDHRLLDLRRPVLDLAAYGAAAQALTHQRLCFVNSHSVILSDGWLELIASAFEEPGVGLAGATASWESQAEWIRGKLRYWPYQLAGLRAARRDYPRFPNPHVRTTGFMIERETLLAMGLEEVEDKRDAYLLESGWESITKRILSRGDRALVVGRDGHPRDVEDWPASHTFRSGSQESLLISDNRTRDWEQASPRLRRRLSRDAWGKRA
jgi:hypothetical protein